MYGFEVAFALSAHVKTQVFLNVVLDDAVEESEKGERTNIGQIVSCAHLNTLPNFLI